MRKVVILLVSGFLFRQTPLFAVQPVFGGSWTLNTLTQFTPAFVFTIKSDLSLSLTFAETTVASRSIFTEAGYRWQSFSATAPFGVFDVFSELTFVPSVPRTDYWLTRMETSLAGVYITLTFLTECVASSEGFGSGIELRIATELPEHINLTITIDSGLEENLAEVYGWTFGSGYDIVPRLNLHSLTYTSTTIEVSGLKLDECKLTTTIKFTKAGFEACELEIIFAWKTCPLRFDLEIAFTPTEKRVVLYPTLSLYQNCLKMYLGVIPWALLPEASTISGLKVNGFGWSCQLASVVFSGIIGIGENLWRPRTATLDIPLRAYNYVVGPDPITAIHYVATPYTAVISWEYRAESVFAVDWYFGTDSTLFGLSLVTVEGKFAIFEGMALTLGAALGMTGTALSFSIGLTF
ncbi:MAG: hypothetical protein QW512_01575 [Thermofilaceae archaeon]